MEYNWWNRWNNNELQWSSTCVYEPSPIPMKVVSLSIQNICVLMWLSFRLSAPEGNQGEVSNFLARVEASKSVTFVSLDNRHPY